MLHRTICNNDLKCNAALQHYFNIVSNGCNIVPTFPGCVVLKICCCELFQNVHNHNYYCHNTFLIELIPAKCAEDSNETHGEAPSNKGNVIISLLRQLQFHCNPDLIKLWWKFFHIFVTGDVVFVKLGKY